jgi:hypothetical protein
MPRFSRGWRAFQGLSWPQRRLLIRAWFLLPLVAAGLRLLGLRRMLALLRPAGVRASPGQHDLAAASAVAGIVNRAANWSLARASCLTRSLVLVRLLQKAGLEADLRIGVRKPKGGFEAHAWVEHQGVALTEPGAPGDRYTTFDDAVFSRGE